MTNLANNEPTDATTTARFLSAGGFHYDVTCGPVPALKDQFNVRITTQWDDARRPDDHQVALNITLSREQLGTVVALLQRSLSEAV